MLLRLGFRKVRTFVDVPAGTVTEIDKHGNFSLIEVTNDGDEPVEFHVNDFTHQGHSGDMIPIPAKTTRVIPLVVYNFHATGIVTVVAYGH